MEKMQRKIILKSFTGQVDFDMKNWYLIFPFSGPDAWHNHFPVAIEGKRQSPIDIETSNIIDGSSVTSSKPLTWSYQKDHCLNIENTGSSWKVNVNGTGSCKLHFINCYKFFDREPRSLTFVLVFLLFFCHFSIFP